MTPRSTDTATLLVSCRDRTGLVAALSQFIAEHGGNITDLDQHAESDSGMFFMRLQWSLTTFTLSRSAIEEALAGYARRFELTWSITWGDHLQRVAVFVSTTPHCLYDLLLHQRLDDLGGVIAVVVSNHLDLADVAAHFQVPFMQVPVGAGSASARAEAEVTHERILADHQIDLVVLARYMQILSPEFVARRPGGIINIHHSFLPAFIGAKPYHQARERGVKLIGATAHYVTAELDQGPIIDQDVCRVTHRDEITDLVGKGRDLERRTLSRAVRLHLQRRVLVHGNRTIIFG